MSTLIPEILHEAALIFLEELDAHLKFFRATLNDLESDHGYVLDGDKARLLAEKFHLVKGASGFLQLSSLKESAAEAEKYFRDKWNPHVSPQEARLHLLKANRVVEEHRDILAEQLKK